MSNMYGSLWGLEMGGNNKRGRSDTNDSLGSFDSLRPLSDNDVEELKKHLFVKNLDSKKMHRNIFLEAFNASELKQITTSKKIPRSNPKGNNKTGRKGGKKPAGKNKV